MSPRCCHLFKETKTNPGLLPRKHFPNAWHQDYYLTKAPPKNFPAADPLLCSIPNKFNANYLTKAAPKNSPAVDPVLCSIPDKFNANLICIIFWIHMLLCLSPKYPLCLVWMQDSFVRVICSHPTSPATPWVSLDKSEFCLVENLLVLKIILE